jgi:hypothetical protein
MPTKIDYVAIYTPIIKILENEKLTPQDSPGVQMAVEIMKETVKEAKNE